MYLTYFARTNRCFFFARRVYCRHEKTLTRRSGVRIQIRRAGIMVGRMCDGDLAAAARCRLRSTHPSSLPVTRVTRGRRSRRWSVVHCRRPGRGRSWGNAHSPRRRRPLGVALTTPRGRVRNPTTPYLNVLYFTLSCNITIVTVTLASTRVWTTNK